MLRHMGRQIGEGDALELPHAHRALQFFVRRQAERGADRSGRRHIIECQQLDRRALAHLRAGRQRAGDVGGERSGFRLVDDAGAAGASALDQPLARELLQRAADGDARDAVEAGEVVLGRQARAVREAVAEDAVAQDQIDPPRFRFAQLLGHNAPPALREIRVDAPRD